MAAISEWQSEDKRIRLGKSLRRMLLFLQWMIHVLHLALRSTLLMRPGPAGRWIALSLRQFGKTFLRGLLAVVLLGILFGVGVGRVSGGPGGLLEAFIEERLLPQVLRFGTPLALAVLLTARTATTLAAKFSDTGDARPERPEADPRRPAVFAWVVWPHLVAGAATGVTFYLLLAWLLAAGYAAAGSLSAMPSQWASLTLWRSDAMWGAAAAFLCGLTVAHVGVAFGLADRYGAQFEEAELGSGQDTRAPPGVSLPRPPSHYVIWESFVGAVVFCVLVTGAFAGLSRLLTGTV